MNEITEVFDQLGIKESDYPKYADPESFGVQINTESQTESVIMKGSTTPESETAEDA